MGHLLSLYVFVENVGKALDSVVVGVGVGKVEMFAATSEPDASGRFASVELAKGIATVGVRLQKKLVGVIDCEVEDASTQFPLETLLKV